MSTTPPPVFTVSEEADRAKPPLPFALEGVWATGYQARDGSTAWREEFTAMSMPPLGAIESLRDALITDPVTRKQVYNPASVIEFIRTVLVADDITRFDDLVTDRTRLCQIAVVASVMFWLVDQYTSGPTGAPSSSTSGGADIGSGVPVGWGSSSGLPTSA